MAGYTANRNATTTSRATASWDVTEETAFDWKAYWRGDVDGGPMNAHACDEDTIDHLCRFFERTIVPDSFAAVGCGEGPVPAGVARRYPDADVWGYDVSETAVENARERHGDRTTLSFGVASVPDPGIDRVFDVVWCVHTLDYVRDVERAVADLYDLVAPGGHLIVRYPNPEVCETYGENVEPGTPLYDRFSLVCEGVNRISRERVDELLAGEVRDFWAVVDAPEDVHGTLSWDPTVAISKPD